MGHLRAGLEADFPVKLPDQDVFDVGGLDPGCWEAIPTNDWVVVSEEAL